MWIWMGWLKRVNSSDRRPGRQRNEDEHQDTVEMYTQVKQDTHSTDEKAAQMQQIANIKY